MTAKEKFTTQVTLPSDTEVRVTRSFHAPRTLVWRAHTDPALARRWLVGYPGWSMPVCEMDVRVGGTYRWRWRQDADGQEFGFFGTFEEVNEPSKLSYDQYYDPDGFSSAMQTDNRCVIRATYAVGHAGGDGVVACFLRAEVHDGDQRGDAVRFGIEVNYQTLDRIFDEQQGG